MSVPLLMTKLYLPMPGKYLVGRARLIEKLDPCLEPGCRLTLISAPAGFGKTTLVSAWIAARRQAAPGWKAAWLSIDEGDNDPVVFWTYAIAALQAQFPGAGQPAHPAPAAPEADLDRAIAMLINDLARLDQPCVLALDDYHLIRSPLIHRSLAFFIEHAPPRLHLLVASRTDPPLPLSLLRGRGQMLEIRLNDLRFSDEDADTYLNAGIGLNLAAPSVRALNQKTEGWIAGLQLAALAMKDSGPPGAENAASFVASFSGSNRFILDYLIEEVLNRQPEPVQRFLMRTSILDRLCAPLCDALLQDSDAGQTDANSTLRYLESGNLFIVPMDQQRYWYRYHHLFADLLRKRLAQTSPEDIRELHRRAIQWYEQNGFIPSAIQHAFQMKDFDKAAALVAQVTEAMYGRGEHATLLGWMAALPDEAKEAYPTLLILQVSMLISAGKMKEAEGCIPVLERYIQSSLAANPEQPALIGNVSALRTYIASFYSDWRGVFAHGRMALENLTRDEDAGQRCAVSLILGNAYLNEGSLDAAVQACDEAIAAGTKAGKHHLVLSSLSVLSNVLLLQDNLSRAAQVCQEGFRLIEQRGLDRSPSAVDLSLCWGTILCERGEPEEAKPYIRRGLDLALEQQFIWQAARGYQAQARMLLAQGSLAEAETAAQAAVQWGETHEIPAYLASQGARLLAGIRLRQGGPAQSGPQRLPQPVLADGGRSPGAVPLAEPLSPREMETLRLIAEGYSNKEIAQKLCLSLRTVKYYSTGLYNKLGVDSRMQAVNRARELGLI